MYDDRGDISFSGLQSDVFGGVRLGFNDAQDTQILLGSIHDVERTTQLYFMEASRRIKSSWTVNVEARIFEDVDESEFSYFFRKDGFLQLSLFKYL